MRMRVLTRTSKGKLITIADQLTKLISADKPTDTIMPAYPCDGERLIIIVASAKSTMPDSFARFVRSLKKSVAANVAFVIDGTPENAAKIVENSASLASYCMAEGIKVSSEGTDNHLMLLDVTSFGLNGRQAESLLRDCGITLNRNALPFDPNGPWYTSGLRIGTPAVTTLGMGDEEMKEIASIITFVLKNAKSVILTKGESAGKMSKNKAKVPESVMAEAKSRVQALLDKFLLYPELDMEVLESEFPLA